ncbi:alpha/beta hydrolase fold domain-containing protein [Dyadobacter chenwenxiniae]|uniref:Alpha/beta hydrolase fold domain-containing protein n=1 Tax=Dyadobacter chenwenxiniae TaxID=2906456 RepID=A0A9X1PMV9_9BACT|nr:alpha/beta hydrolase [Dyadobacter chenwenxiniae]MCF0064262.1 alpha/beta hydrolase fold domain-containing protein [Dyadobacter chenwenxiniae]UON82525.1 alpha/beta hydrolase fold domain-containing protein [Dyadobacter chenwenxiniae]
MKTEARITLIVLMILLGAFMLTLSGCSFKRITKSKNIVYQKAYKTSAEQQLNVFTPKKHSEPKNVLIFVHGGNWNSGKKSQYSIIGGHWARKDVVTVIVDYPLSPAADYKAMAISIAKSVKWVKENISQYGGDPDKIFLSGHSAGGHLAALVALDDHYFKNIGLENPLAGLILIDAAGLDMHGYLTEEQFEKGNTYLRTFSSDSKTWKEATPLYHLHQNMPPMLIYRGGKTYPSILKSNEKFINALHAYAPETDYRIQKSKKHVPMITQFFNPWNRRYGEILEFMKAAGSKMDLPEDKRNAAVGK